MRFMRLWGRGWLGEGWGLGLIVGRWIWPLGMRGRWEVENRIAGCDDNQKKYSIATTHLVVLDYLSCSAIVIFGLLKFGFTMRTGQ